MSNFLPKFVHFIGIFVDFRRMSTVIGHRRVIERIPDHAGYAWVSFFMRWWRVLWVNWVATDDTLARFTLLFFLDFFGFDLFLQRQDLSFLDLMALACFLNKVLEMCGFSLVCFFNVMVLLCQFCDLELLLGQGLFYFDQGFLLQIKLVLELFHEKVFRINLQLHLL